MARRLLWGPPMRTLPWLLGTAAALSDENYLALLRVRLPALGSDIDTLSRALAQKPTAEQLVAAGAAIDHIERNIIT